MSRIGKKLLTVPQGVTITTADHVVTVKGPKGELSHPVHPLFEFVVEGDGVQCKAGALESASDRALWGLYGAIMRNMIAGVTSGFQKQLEVRGVGYKSRVEGTTLVLDIGYSHEVRFPIPKDVSITAEKNILTIAGIDKQQVGQVASHIRALRKPEPYKGKGIRYVDEVILIKAGKAAKTAAK